MENVGVSCGFSAFHVKFEIDGISARFREGWKEVRCVIADFQNNACSISSFFLLSIQPHKWSLPPLPPSLE